MRFALDILFDEEMLTVVNGVGELADPVAEDNYSCFLAQLKVELDMSMPIDEEIDIGMLLHIRFGEAHQRFLVLTHIGRFLSVFALQSAMLGPVETKGHAPSGMDSGEQALAQSVAEDRADEFELRVGVAQSISVVEEEHLAIELCGERLSVEHHTAFIGQITIGPDVMVAYEIMNLHTHVGEFRELAKETAVAFRHDKIGRASCRERV